MEMILGSPWPPSIFYFKAFGVNPLFYDNAVIDYFRLCWSFFCSACVYLLLYESGIKNWLSVNKFSYIYLHLKRWPPVTLKFSKNR